MKIGILGGTFDPIHKGHLALADAAVKLLGLTQIIFVPAFCPPLKEKDTEASPEHRYNMVELAVSNNPRYSTSDAELKRRGISYTVDTIRYFRNCYPHDDLYFLTGGDWGKTLNSWKGIDEIFNMAHFVVARRPGYEKRGLPNQVEFLDFVPLDISSTGIRERVRKGENVFSELTPEVYDYIRRNNLYVKE